MSEQRVIAFLLDRAEQYDQSSGYRAFVAELVRGIARGEHHDAWNHGEYDDLKKRVRLIMKSHEQQRNGGKAP